MAKKKQMPQYLKDRRRYLPTQGNHEFGVGQVVRVTFTERYPRNDAMDTFLDSWVAHITGPSTVVGYLVDWDSEPSSIEDSDDSGWQRKPYRASKRMRGRKTRRWIRANTIEMCECYWYQESHILPANIASPAQPPTDGMICIDLVNKRHRVRIYAADYATFESVTPQFQKHILGTHGQRPEVLTALDRGPVLMELTNRDHLLPLGD